MPKGKPKTKKPQGGNTGKRAGRRRARGPPRGMANMDGATMAVCAITDPFCAMAKGARYPDSHAQRSFGVQAQQFFTLTTNNVGSVALGIKPSAPYCYAITTPGAGVSTGSFGANYTEVSNGFAAWVNSFAAQFRVVSFGVEITPLTNAMTSTGVITLQEFDDSPLLGTSFDTSVSSTTSVGDAPQTIVVPLAQLRPVTWRSRPGGVQSRQFNPLTPNTGDTSYDWTCLRVLVNGGVASTAAVMVRIVANYEFTVSLGQPVSMLAKPAPPQNSLITRAATVVQQKASGFLEGTAQRVEGYISNLAGNALRMLAGQAFRAAGTAIGGYIGGPYGAAGGRAIAGGASQLLIEDVD